MNSTFQMLIDVASALVYETELCDKTFLNDVSSLEELTIKYTTLQLLLRRIEVAPDDDFSAFSYDYIDANSISPFIIGEILYSLTSRYARRTLIYNSISQYFLHTNNMKKYIEFSAGQGKYASQNNTVKDS